MNTFVFVVVVVDAAVDVLAAAVVVWFWVVFSPTIEEHKTSLAFL